MRKFISLWCLLYALVNLSAQDTSNIPKTYTVTVQKLTTTLENVLPDPIPIFDVPNYQKVATNDSYQIDVAFTEGLITKQLITRKDASGVFYNILFYVTPVCNLKITDVDSNTLFERRYGGDKQSTDWGKPQKFKDSETAYQAWRTEREKVWKKLEYEVIDWAKIKADVHQVFNSFSSTDAIDLVDTNQKISTDSSAVSKADNPIPTGNDNEVNDVPETNVGSNTSGTNETITSTTTSNSIGNKTNSKLEKSSPIVMDKKSKMVTKKKRSTNVTKLVGSVIN